jgi:hypothetical protein
MAVHGRTRIDLLNAFEAAVDDVLNGNPPDVGAMRGAREALGRVYDAVLNNPAGGPADEALAVLRSPEFARILLERGPSAFDKNGNLVVRGSLIRDQGFDDTGFGLVKIIWLHGEKRHDTRPDADIFRVTREDVMSLPQILENYAPVTTGRGGKNLTWVIDGGNGTRLVVAVGKRKGGAEPTTITMFRSTNESYYPLPPIREALESPRGPRPASDAGALRLPRDTPAATSVRQQRGQGLSDGTVAPASPEVNPFAVAAPETFAPAPEPGAIPRSVLEEHGIDRGTGASLEETLAREAERFAPLPEEERAAFEKAARDAESGFRRSLR